MKKEKEEDKEKRKEEEKEKEKEKEKEEEEEEEEEEESGSVHLITRLCCHVTRLERAPCWKDLLSGRLELELELEPGVEACRQKQESRLILCGRNSRHGDVM
ncbi:hypothetical protein LSTR_LSTR009332 [Laodelphax striatellus]|uniref:Uncharacterized protein n=1 Tax=Laodelphax striatellus TaxID=195883 RepID=A0A482XJK5_LAOST|nr:hypothetical protein LSTR_LSTR009332 [Laodelphax striatellus]